MFASHTFTDDTTLSASMTKDLLRWEDSPGLEHHCPKCATPLNNPRAKNTCYHKHVEICEGFHQQFFKIGQSHTCEPCRRKVILHNDRHRQITMLLRQLAQLQKEHGCCTCPSVPSPASPVASRRSSGNSTGSNLDDHSTPMSKRERKLAKKRTKALKGGDALTSAEIDRVNQAIHPNPPSEAETLPTEELDDTPMTNPRRDSGQSTDLEIVTQACISFCAHVDGRLNSARQRLQNQLLDSIAGTTVPEDFETAMTNLGVLTSSSRTPRPVAEVVEKIRVLVRQDLEACESDSKECRIREAAWYRFVTRGVIALGQE